MTPPLLTLIVSAALWPLVVLHALVTLLKGLRVLIMLPALLPLRLLLFALVAPHLSPISRLRELELMTSTGDSMVSASPTAGNKLRNWQGCGFLDDHRSLLIVTTPLAWRQVST